MIDYTYYYSIFPKGRIPQDEFSAWANQAEDIVSFFEREYTVTADSDQRSRAVCAIADAAYTNNVAASAALAGMTGDGGAVASRSIGSVSVSYRQATAAEAGVNLSEKAQRRQYYDILRRYAVINRGVR